MRRSLARARPVPMSLRVGPPRGVTAGVWHANSPNNPASGMLHLLPRGRCNVLRLPGGAAMSCVRLTGLVARVRSAPLPGMSLGTKGGCLSPVRTAPAAVEAGIAGKHRMSGGRGPLGAERAYPTMTTRGSNWIDEGRRR